MINFLSFLLISSLLSLLLTPPSHSQGPQTLPGSLSWPSQAPFLSVFWLLLPQSGQKR